MPVTDQKQEICSSLQDRKKYYSSMEEGKNCEKIVFWKCHHKLTSLGDLTREKKAHKIDSRFWDLLRILNSSRRR